MFSTNNGTNKNCPTFEEKIETTKWMVVWEQKGSLEVTKGQS